MEEYTLGTSVTIDATFTQLGVPTDPPTVQLVIAKPGDADTTYTWPAGPLGPIVRLGPGAFTADVITDTEGLWAWAFRSTGAGAVAHEGQFRVETVLTDPLDLLVSQEDYEGIRHALGVTKLDVTDPVIEGLLFGRQAELRVKGRVTDWTTYDDTEEGKFRLRMATAYATAALIAETMAKGGFIGLANDGRLADRDWDADAAHLWSRSEEWIGLILADTLSVGVATYELPGVILTGPTRSRVVGTPQASPVPIWLYGYPARLE